MRDLDNAHRLRVGDQITFRVVEDRDPSVALTVMDSGEIHFPYLGRIPAAGRTSSELAQLVKEKLEIDYYYQATVLIGLDPGRTQRGRVYVFGGVNTQGTVDLPVDEIMTVSKVILKAGGFTNAADRSQVRIERGGENEERKTFTVNIAAVLEQGRTDQDIVVEPNDFIIIPQQGDLGRVLISGEVGRPGPVPVSGGRPLMLSEAIISAGGFGRFADERRVRVVRTGPDGQSEEFIVDVKAVLEGGNLDKDFILQPEDRVIVRAKLFNF